MRKLLLANGFGRKMWVSVLRQGFAHPDPYSVAIPCASSRKCSRPPTRRGFGPPGPRRLLARRISAVNTFWLRTQGYCAPCRHRSLYRAEAHTVATEFRGRLPGGRRAVCGRPDGFLCDPAESALFAHAFMTTLWLSVVGIALAAVIEFVCAGAIFRDPGGRAPGQRVRGTVPEHATADSAFLPLLRAAHVGHQNVRLHVRDRGPRGLGGAYMAGRVPRRFGGIPRIQTELLVHLA